MFGSRISLKEVQRLRKRVEELRRIQEQLGLSEVEMLTALISLEDWKKAHKEHRRSRGEED